MKKSKSYKSIVYVYIITLFPMVLITFVKCIVHRLYTVYAVSTQILLPDYSYSELIHEKHIGGKYKEVADRHKGGKQEDFGNLH